MRNKRATGRDMLISMAVLLIPALLITWFFQRTPDKPPIATVDWRPALAQAEAEADYPVVAPKALPIGWRCVSAKWVPAGQPIVGETIAAGDTWVLGVLTDQDVYLSVNQQAITKANTAAVFVADVTRNGKDDGTQPVGATTWARQVSADGRTRSLVQHAETAVTIVAGDTDYQALADYAASLQAN